MGWVGLGKHSGVSTAECNLQHMPSELCRYCAVHILCPSLSRFSSSRAFSDTREWCGQERERDWCTRAEGRRQTEREVLLPLQLAPPIVHNHKEGEIQRGQRECVTHRHTSSRTRLSSAS